MNAMQGVMWELGINAEEMISEMISDNNGLMPPGFRFHPTDEELITFYLASKVFNGGLFCGVDIMEVDLNRCEPWELPDMAKMGEREWYFYSLRDRKYPTGLRTNRATGAGYWKATGKDREVHSASSGNSLVGMKKTLVFYKGRAPRGEKTKWVLHEYRLEGDFSCRLACKEEWVICRIFNKSEIVSNNQHKKNNQLYSKQSSLFSTPHGLNHHSSTSTNHPFPNLQTLESPIQSLLNNDNPFLINHHDHHHQDLNQLSNPFIPQQDHCQFQEDASATSFSNWLDVYEMAIGSSTSQLDFGALC